MNRTLERSNRAAVICIVIRNFSRNFLFSAYTKCLNKPAASTQEVIPKMKVYNPIATHDLRPTLTSAYFFTWKRSLVPCPMGEHLVWVRPQEDHCSSLPVRGICLQEGHCSSLPVRGLCPQEGHRSSLPVGRYVLKDTVPVCRWGAVRPQERHCSSLPQTDFSLRPITTVLQATYVGPLPIRNVHSVVISQTQFT
jgi:hypothetical protein